MSAQEEKHHVRWYRSSIFSAFCVAMTAFTCPGMFSALNGMGAGGGVSPGTSNAANAIVFGVLAVGSIFAGGFSNRLTPKYTLLVSYTAARPPSRHLNLYRLVPSAIPLMLLDCMLLIGLGLPGFCSSVPLFWASPLASYGYHLELFSWGTLKRTERGRPVSSNWDFLDMSRHNNICTSVHQVRSSSSWRLRWRDDQFGAQRAEKLSRWSEQAHVHCHHDDYELRLSICSDTPVGQKCPTNRWTESGPATTAFVGQRVQRPKGDF